MQVATSLYGCQARFLTSLLGSPLPRPAEASALTTHPLCRRPRLAHSSPPLKLTLLKPLFKAGSFNNSPNWSNPLTSPPKCLNSWFILHYFALNYESLILVTTPEGQIMNTGTN